MTLCRSCGHSTPGAGSFCEGCGSSFNARICPAKHLSSSTAGFCAVCGSDDLSTPAVGTRVNMPGALGRLVIAVLLLKIVILFAPALVHCLLVVTQSLLEFELGGHLALVLQWLLSHFMLWCAIWLLLRVALGENSKILRVYTDSSRKLASLGFTAFMRGIEALWRWLVQSKGPSQGAQR